MSQLTIFEDEHPATPVLQTREPETIARALNAIGVLFERWNSPVALAADAEAEVILEAYRPYLDELMRGANAGSADVIKLTPDAPNAAALRTKFLSEHIHTEDEIRFFVQGSGHFIMHVNGQVYDAHCEAGDLISVPANTMHWFDAGPNPSFTALRIFTDTTGWVPHYTGNTIAERFPFRAA